VSGSSDLVGDGEADRRCPVIWLGGCKYQSRN
jgi:hypothetical protein